MLGLPATPALDLASGMSLGTASGPVTCSLEEYRLLAESDSDSQEEPWCRSRGLLRLRSRNRGRKRQPSMLVPGHFLYISLGILLASASLALVIFSAASSPFGRNLLPTTAKDPLVRERSKG